MLFTFHNKENSHKPKKRTSNYLITWPKWNISLLFSFLFATPSSNPTLQGCHTCYINTLQGEVKWQEFFFVNNCLLAWLILWIIIRYQNKKNYMHILNAITFMPILQEGTLVQPLKIVQSKKLLEALYCSSFSYSRNLQLLGLLKPCTLEFQQIWS